MSKKREPAQHARDSYPQTFHDIREIPLVHYHDGDVEEAPDDAWKRATRARIIQQKYDTEPLYPWQFLENLSEDEIYRLKQAYASR